MKEYKRRIDHSWDFPGVDTKEYTHCYHTYPAMMIPQIARRLIQEYHPAGECNVLLDPYCGSGTSLVEAMLAGMCAEGYDLNPLAELISNTKTKWGYSTELKNDISKIEDSLKDYQEGYADGKDFSRISNYSYWYSPEVLSKLQYINDKIEDLEASIWFSKIFLKIALAETVRDVSFTRNSEFKRYRMDEEKLKKFNPDVFETFLKKLDRNLNGLLEFEGVLEKNPKSGGAFLANSSELPEDFIALHRDLFPYDMVVTSPPYGDSKTTVAYGQFSRWANEWFNFQHAKDLDNILMGGKKQKEPIFETETINDKLEEIKSKDEGRYYEVISFLNDYWKSIKSISEMVRSGGVVCYVVGNRTVKGVQIDLDYFTAEMFEKCGFKHRETIVRTFPVKRMPSKNSPSNVTGDKGNTMSNEYIVILEKD